MSLLRIVLRWQAVLAATFGVVLVAAPSWLIEGVLDQPPLSEEAWARLLGVTAIALAAQMVLVLRRLEDLWWWTWTFVAAELGLAIVFAFNALLGLPEGAPAWPWWAACAASLGWAGLDVAGLAKTGTERPPV